MSDLILECQMVAVALPPGDAARDAIHNLSNRVEALEEVYFAAVELVASGYDGPFMGEPIRRLFEAVTKAADK